MTVAFILIVAYFLAALLVDVIASVLTRGDPAGPCRECGGSGWVDSGEFDHDAGCPVLWDCERCGGRS